MTTEADLTGKLVRWENDGQWLTARIRSTGVFRDSWAGEVVDPGNYVGTNHPYFAESRVEPGDWLPNLRDSLITPIAEDDTATS